MHAPRRPSAIFPVLALLLAASPAAWASDVRVGLLEPPDKAAGAIRLSTYNIENLFDDDDDPALTGRFDDCHSYDKTVRAKPAAQQRAAARAIRSLDADVIAFQEIESFDALNEFRITHLEGLGYKYIVSIDVGQERGIENAVISRYPVREATVWPNMPLEGVHPDRYGDRPNMYAGEPLVFRRSPLRVVVEVPSKDGGDPYELTLFVVHHKAGRYNEYWREAEMKAVAKMVSDLEKSDPGRNIAVLGDFNAQLTDPSMVGLMAGSSLEPARDAPPSDRTAMTHSSSRRIDFIMVNDALRPDLVAGSSFVLGTPMIPADADWRTAPKPTGYASDHAPVSVDVVPKEK